MNTIKERLPNYARDLRLNLKVLESSDALNDQQRLGTLLAAAMAGGNAEFLGLVREIVEEGLSPKAAEAVGVAHSLMAMNNIYYRYVHLVSDAEVTQLPARLRMQAMADPESKLGVPKLDFELWSLAVSAINGCGMCMDSHTKALRKQGASPVAIQDVIRMAAVVHAAARNMDLAVHAV